MASPEIVQPFLLMAAIGIHAFILTADAPLASRFTNLWRELGIETRSSKSSDSASDQLQRGKYDALVLDFDTVQAARSVLGVLRSVSVNKNAVVFAVATDAEHREQALREGVHFLLQRPVETSSMRETLKCAYDLMRVERRRYFRCLAELPVQLKLHNSAEVIRCSTMNVSTSGVAVATPIPLTPAQTLDIVLDLPNGFAVRGSALVIWDDKHGKSGLKLSCSEPEMRRQLDAWLDSQFSGPKSKAS